METDLRKFILLLCISCFSLFAYGQYNSINKAIALKQYDEAIALLEQAIEHDRSNPELYYNLGTAYMNTDQFGQALWAFENVVNLVPNHENAMKNAQYIYNELEKGEFVPYLPGFIYQLRVIGSNTFAYIALACSVAITVIFLISKSFKTSTQNRIAYSFILGLIIMIAGCIILSVFIWTEDEYQNTGVITSPNTPTYLSNYDLAPYQIQMGTRFDIIEKLTDKMWKIKIEDEKTVIIKSEHARLINTYSTQMP